MCQKAPRLPAALGSGSDNGAPARFERCPRGEDDQKQLQEAASAFRIRDTVYLFNNGDVWVISAALQERRERKKFARQWSQLCESDTWKAWLQDGLEVHIRPTH